MNPIWTAFALGIIPGVFVGLWLANRRLKELNRGFRWEREQYRKRIEFWRKRWVDLVTRLDEQDSKL